MVDRPLVHFPASSIPAMKILTFDIEEWFHILDTDATRSEDKWAGYESRIHANTDRILGALSGTRHRATFFCLGWIAKKYPDIIRKIDKEGYEIASHSSLHQLVYDLKPDVFRSDVLDSLHTLEDITGGKITMFRAPGFSAGSAAPWAFEVLAECGIEIDCSVFPARHGHGGFREFGHARPAVISVNGKSLKEFPINLFSVGGRSLIFSGGGYFRLLPYPLIAGLFKRADYCMTYFHPRDFDPTQPVIKGLSFRRRFKSYYGVRGAFAKLKKLLADFEFTDVGTAATSVDWENAPVVRL
jgi:polysaccharide deacetylase family protein (PEP-CTERM system associated)